MKARKIVLVLFVLSFSLLTRFGVSSAGASTYLGEVCWASTQGNDSIVTRLGFSYLGDGHFVLAGKMTKNGTVLHNTLNGNGEIHGNNFHTTLTHSGKSGIAMWTGIIRMVLDISTFNGTAESIGHDYNYSDSTLDTQFNNAIPVTLIQCP